MPRPFLRTLYLSNEITFIGFVSTSEYKGCNSYLKIIILHSKFDNRLTSVIRFENSNYFFDMFMQFLILLNDTIGIANVKVTILIKNCEKNFFDHIPFAHCNVENLFQKSDTVTNLVKLVDPIPCFIYHAHILQDNKQNKPRFLLPACSLFCALICDDSFFFIFIIRKLIWALNSLVVTNQNKTKHQLWSMSADN